MKIALAGNPNCGKTTMFNALTGSNQYVGNWPGVTVEKKTGILKTNSEIQIIDLPGIYSLSPYSLDERVAREYLINERPDIIINLVDATNLERSLYLTTQLREIGIPMVIALNMSDLLKKDQIDTDQLSKLLECPIVHVSALKNEGLEQLISHAYQLYQQPRPTYTNIYHGNIAIAIEQIKAVISEHYEPFEQNWYAIKYLENEEELMNQQLLNQSQYESISKIRERLETDTDDDSESIITVARYEYITELLSKTYRPLNSGISISDRIDRIVTHRILALPIFAAIMTFIYYMAVTGIGGIATDWVNDVLFTEIIPPAIENVLISIHCADWLMSLILDGIVAGVGAVLGFVPQMLVLFLFLALLEEIGYMARIAFILDRLFRKFGLSGKSFIPMLIGTGCSVPGIMASRTIENESDRRMTVITTSFIPCSAKLPIIALIAGALFQGAWWVSPSAYFIGIAAVILSGITLKKTSLFAEGATPFLMELPAYHMPKVNNVLRSTWERGFSFMKKAGTVILLSTMIIWFLSSFGVVSGHIKMLGTDQLDQSFLAALGSALSFLFIPLGWGNWESTVAAISGLVAKENVVSTFGILYGYGEIAEDGAEIWGSLAASFTMASAYSFMIFNLLCAPCFAAIGAIKREMNHRKWTIFAISYQCALAYAVSFIVYQLWVWLDSGIFTLMTAFAGATLIGMLYMLLRVKRNYAAGKQVSQCQAS